MHLYFPFVVFKHCVCLRGGNTHWGTPGWTMLVCSAPVCTLSVSVAVRREYTNSKINALFIFNSGQLHLMFYSGPFHENIYCNGRTPKHATPWESPLN